MTPDEAFSTATDSLVGVVVHPEIVVTEAPAPKRLAPHAYAVTAEVGVEPEVGSGRFVLLHDPSRPESWQSDTRVVVYVETDIDPEMAADQLLTDVGWTWLQESLGDVAYTALGGTVTAVRSTSYDALATRGHETSIQIRASWSPAALEGIAGHFAAWLELISVCAGLPPHHPDVTRIGESA